MSLTPDMSIGRFADRRAAGRELADRLGSLALENPVVLGLARGGVPVAYEVARALGAPLDVLAVRKIGAPANPELGIGAVAEGDVRVLDADAVRRMLVSTEELEAAIARARAEVRASAQRFRNGRPPLEVRGRTAIVVDDGLATGGTARAALRAIRARGPSRLVLAVPVGAPDAVRSLADEADQVVCVLQPEEMWAVGLWYKHFQPTDDAEVVQLLSGEDDDPPPVASLDAREVRIPAAEILGDLAVPKAAVGLVVFAHGSGSSRFSPRNRQVAAALNQRGLATLLLDLLQWDEERDRTNVFDTGLLTERLVAATRWARSQPDLGELPVGYFGASTGAAAALRAAAELPTQVGAVVSRGGRPDLVTAWLTRVRAPVLLIVGGRDELVLELNREAQRFLGPSCALAVVPAATHLFPEPGALEEVSLLAGDWFDRHLVTR
ncbi:MAG TPA: phosphoribosyltransferase family protein [Solirubrobacteraceae bacterium]|nr:phosphoribosyltransferase family protein [Solirubrobacteraceae bacterium]